MYCRVFSSIPGFCPLDARDACIPTIIKTKNASRHCQMFLEVVVVVVVNCSYLRTTPLDGIIG